MMSIRILLRIGHTEAVLITRSWIFRFYAIISILGLTVANTVLFVGGSNGMNLTPWMLRAIPSSVPYFNALVLTMVGCVFLAFGVIDSIRRERTFDTAASIHAHDFTNIVFIAGKALGVMSPYLMVQAAMLALVYTVNSVFMNDVPVVSVAYLLYPLLIAVPAYVFVTGAGLMLINYLRQSSIVLLLLLGILLLPFFIISGLFMHLFDYNAIHLPLLYSDFVGFGNMGEILLHRGLFLCVGLGLIALSALRFDRLPQSLPSRKITMHTAFVLLAAGVLSGGLFFGGKVASSHLRARMQALNEEYVTQPRARMAACHLDVTHRGSSLMIEATLTLANHRDTPLDRIALSLNPGYNIATITAEGRSLEYTRDTQIIDIVLPEPLASGDSQIVTVSYHGTPDDHAMYPDIDETRHTEMNRLFTHVIDKRHAFVTPDYILLTPQSLWYPVSGIPYGMVFPDAYEKDFTDYTLDLSTSDGLTAISQGEVTDLGAGSFRVRPETKLTGLTLIAGEYEKRSTVLPGQMRPINADGDMLELKELELALYTKPGHDYFTPYAEGHEEAFLADLPRGKVRSEMSRGVFPYQSYRFIEVPVQFYTYNRMWGMPTDTVQPQMNLLPEKGCFLSLLDMGKHYDRARENLVSRGQPFSEDDINKSIMGDIGDLVYQSVIPIFEDTPRQRMVPLFDNLDRAYVPEFDFNVQYGPFLHSVESQTTPMLSAVMERYLGGNYRNYTLETYYRTHKALDDAEITCMALERMSLQEYLESIDDAASFETILNLKTSHLMNELGALTGSWQLNDFMNEFFTEHRFENVRFETLAAAMDSTFGIDTPQVVNRWNATEGIPHYVIGDIEVVEVVSEDTPVFNTTMTITNTSSVRGIVSFFLMSTRVPPQYVPIEAEQTVEIGFISDGKPSSVEFNTIFSDNLPLGFTKQVSREVRQVDIEPFEGVRILDYQPNREQPGVIVVDNLDTGFEIVADTPDQQQEREYGFGHYPEDFICIDFENPPPRWGKGVFSDAYGDKRTAYYTKSGSGNRQVSWTAEITEAGWYDLEYFVPDILGHGVLDVNANFFGEHSFKVRHGDSVSSVALAGAMFDGWQYLTSVELEPGQVEVLLSNESDGVIIYADAIRWVKK